MSLNESTLNVDSIVEVPIEVKYMCMKKRIRQDWALAFFGFGEVHILWSKLCSAGFVLENCSVKSDNGPKKRLQKIPSLQVWVLLLNNPPRGPGWGGGIFWPTTHCFPSALRFGFDSRSNQNCFQIISLVLCSQIFEFSFENKLLCFHVYYLIFCSNKSPTSISSGRRRSS